MAEQAPATVQSRSEGLLGEIANLLARPPRVDGIELFSSFVGAATRAVGGVQETRTLLPADFEWRAPGPAPGKTLPRVPLQLCEFLAYKTALAYESEQRIRSCLTECCTGYSRIQFFDSAHEEASMHGHLADAQGYGFVFERKAFVIFRGTTSGADWKINSTDALTDDVMVKKDRRYDELRSNYGPLLDKLGDPEPGRHVGFSIAWAALKDMVENWLADLLLAREIDQIVYSGHSLGGAMAQIAAFDHARIEDALGKDREIKLDHIAAVVTFGAPAAGSKEFAPVYKRLLGDKTVLIESSGDLVPRIMNRWYYRMLYPLRQRVMSGVQLHLKKDDAFDKVATPWTFAQEPPLSLGDIDAGMRALAELAKKAAEERDKNKDKPEQKSETKTEKSSSKDQPGTDEGKAASAADKSSTTKPAEKAPSWAYWLAIGLIALAITVVIWYFVRRKLFSHDIEQRYALYLSTLSYQQLRARHNGDLKLANAELDEHLRFVRGDVNKGIELAKTIPDSENKPTPFFDSVKTLPVAITLRDDPMFLDYLRKNETFL